MKIEIISCLYKEHFFLPLFYRHYGWVDRITLITEKFKNGMDDFEKTDCINSEVSRSNAEVLIVLDADEFVFPSPYGSNPRTAIESEFSSGSEAIVAAMRQVWRGQSELDAVPNMPPVPQRIHGESDIENRLNSCYVKPCIFKNGLGISVGIGCHAIHLDRAIKYAPTRWSGSHWGNAEPSIMVGRIKDDRQARLSKRNRDAGAGIHHDFSTEELQSMCRIHSNDPVVVHLPNPIPHWDW